MIVDYYAILEIEYPSSPDEIRKAYRRLSAKWHPDTHPNEDTTEQMVAINEAYFILKDSDKKSRYDEEYIRYKHFESNTKHSQTSSTASSQHNSEYAYTKEDVATYSQSTYHNYHFHNTKVQDDIYEAHKVATDLVDEFLKQFKANSKNAAKGATEAMWPYVGAIIITSIIFSLIRSCQ